MVKVVGRSPLLRLMKTTCKSAESIFPARQLTMN
jgi:hypothetical protein